MALHTRDARLAGSLSVPGFIEIDITEQEVVVYGNGAELGDWTNVYYVNVEGSDPVQGIFGDDRITIHAGDSDSSTMSIDVYALGGPDHVSVDGGGDGTSVNIWGDSGNDVIDCAGCNQAVSVMGGDGNDQIGGGSGDDSLYGEDGDDTINGNGGNDHLYGGANNDDLSGGDNNDWIEGGYGSDLMDGDNGNDTLNAQDGEEDRQIDGGGDYDCYFWDNLLDPVPVNCEQEGIIV